MTKIVEIAFTFYCIKM